MAVEVAVVALVLVVDNNSLRVGSVSRHVELAARSCCYCYCCRWQLQLQLQYLLALSTGQDSAIRSERHKSSLSAGLENTQESIRRKVSRQTEQTVYSFVKSANRTHKQKLIIKWLISQHGRSQYRGELYEQVSRQGHESAEESQLAPVYGRLEQLRQRR